MTAAEWASLVKQADREFTREARYPVVYDRTPGRAVRQSKAEYHWTTETAS